MKVFTGLLLVAALIGLALGKHQQYRHGQHQYGSGYGNQYGHQNRHQYGHQNRYQYGHNYHRYGYKKIVCEKLIDPANGNVKISGIYPGDKAIYKCDIGYILVGESSRKCLPSGKWSGEAPTCAPVDCGTPPSPVNGAVAFQGTTLGNKAVHSCNQGYILAGAKVRVCQANGQWSDEVAQCNPVDCGNPDDPDPNGDVSFDSTTLGSTATYSCNPGFLVDVSQGGSVVVTCLASGVWSDTAPACKPIDCGDPDDPDPNGDVSFDSTTLGSTATYSCNPGFLIDVSQGGSVVVTCLASGVWSDTAPGCIPVDCGPLENPENGQVSYSTTTYLSIATYTCNPGYIRVGTRVRGCLANGEWSSLAPTCQPVDCGDPDAPDPNGDVSFDSTTLGSTATYSCNPGFLIDVSQGGSVVVTCLASGLWSDTAPACIPIDCGDPDEPDDNGDVSFDSTTFGSTATYSCDDGFLLDDSQGGSEVVTCLASGVWSDTAPACIPIDCGDPDAPDPNGDVSFDSTTFGSTATYSCNPGFLIAGSAVVTCLASGEWSDTAPACIPIDCGDPDAPDDNGDVSFDSTTLGSTATYSCNPGFLVDDSQGGSEVVTCLVSGVWSDTAPGCKPVDCGLLPAPFGGSVQFNPNTLFGSDAIFTCKRGLKLVGDSQRRCQANGQWSGSQPSCEKIKCPKLTPPVYGKIYTSGYYPGGRAIYSCTYGYSLVGKHRLVCTYSGKWSGNPPSCTKDHHYGYHHNDYSNNEHYKYGNNYHDDDDDDNEDYHG